MTAAAAWSATTHYHAGDKVLSAGKTYRANHSNVGEAPPGRSWVEVAATGTPIVRAFPIAFNTAGILTGAALYTPTIGDLLLDAWFEIDTAWNGTTPKGDFGSFVGGHVGILATRTAVQDMTVADVTTPGGLKHQVIGSVLATKAPGKFTTADPLKVVVSQNGQDNGADPAATAGAGVLYIVTCTPV